MTLARRSFVRRHAGLFKAATSLVLLLAFLVISELGFRVVRFAVRGPDIKRALTADDAELGWHLNASRTRTTTRNSCGETVLLERYDDPYLVKRPRYHNPTRVLFLGDSFTQAHEVSTGSAYYDVFEQLTGDRYSVFAAGVGGFGNLQEYLLLQRVSDEVRPEIVIWQLDPNDVSNNVFALDNGSLYNNQHPRPYLEPKTGRVTFRDPGFFLFDVSKLFRFLFHKVLVVDWKYHLGILDAANSLIRPPNSALPELTEQGLNVLRTMLRHAVQDHPGTRFFGFATGDEYDLAYQEIFQDLGAGYFPEVSRIVASDPEPTNCLPLDGHWNHHGNEVAGRLLARELDRALRSATDAPPDHSADPGNGNPH